MHTCQGNVDTGEPGSILSSPVLTMCILNSLQMGNVCNSGSVAPSVIMKLRVAKCILAIIHC